MVMWHKINDGSIVRSVGTLPESERLSDGSWVTGFRGADPDVVAAAGWAQSDDPPERPDDGHAQSLVWTLNGDGTVTGGWVQGGLLPAPERTAEDRLAEAHQVLEDGAVEIAALPAPTTPADVSATMADILARAAAALNGGV